MFKPIWLAILSFQILVVFSFDQSYCYASFQQLQFDILNFSRYTHFFNGSTTLRLTETGVYTGVDEIEEYVRTGAHPRHYTNFSALDSQTSFKIEQTAPDLCVFLQVNTVQTWTHDLAFPGAKKKAAYMLKVYYDPVGKKITKINVYYPKGWLDIKYTALLNTDAARTYVCDIMLRRCPNTWAFNNLTTMEYCTSKMAGLALITPPTSKDIGGYLDGKTQACRQLHAMMAEMSPDRHCAHLSFLPQVDPKGKIKCQNSAQLQVHDSFDDSDLATYSSIARLTTGEKGFSVDIGCNSISDCPSQHYCHEKSCKWVETCKDAKIMYRQQDCCGQRSRTVNSSSNFDNNICGQVKAAYKRQACCNNPTKMFMVGN